MILALLVMLAGGWLLWRSARFDRWLAAATLVGLLALALRRPAVNGLSLLMLVVLAAVTAAAGRWLMRRLGLPTDRTATTLFFAWMIGCGLLILTALALGLLHGLSVWTLGAALILGALLSRRDLRWLVQSALAWRPALPAGSSQRLLALALAPFALLDLLGALAPSAAFDATWYHLFIPRLFLQAGSLAYFPAHYRSLWPSNVEMLNLWGLALAGDQLAQLIGLGLTLLLLLGVFVAARASGLAPRLDCWPSCSSSPRRTLPPMRLQPMWTFPWPCFCWPRHWPGCAGMPRTRQAGCSSPR